MNQESMPHYQLSLQRLSDTYKNVGDGDNSDISVSQNFENNKFIPKKMQGMPTGQMMQNRLAHGFGAQRNTSIQDDFGQDSERFGEYGKIDENAENSMSGPPLPPMAYQQPPMGYTSAPGSTSGQRQYANYTNDSRNEF